MGGEPLAVPMMMRPGGEVVVVVENVGVRGVISLETWEWVRDE